MHERRAHSRIAFNREVYVTFDDEHSLLCMAHDFSMRGIGLLTDEAIALDTVLSIELQMMNHESNREVTLRGRVVHSRAEGSQYKMGISFY